MTMLMSLNNVKLFLDTGGVSDGKRSGQPLVIRTPPIIKVIRSRINRNPDRKQKIVAREMGIVPRTVSRIIKQDLGLRAFKRQTRRLTFALKENRNKKDACCCTEKSVKHKSSLQMKHFLLWSKLLISKTIDFMHGHPRKPANWCQVSNEVIILPQ